MFRQCPLILALCLGFLGPLWSQEVALQDLPEDLPHNYGVIGVRLETIADTLTVSNVRPFGPANLAGLLEGDQLFAALPYRMRTAQDFSRYIKSLLPGTEVELLIARNDSTQTLICQVSDVRHLYLLMGEMGKTSIPAQQRHHQWHSQVGAIESQVLSLIDSLDVQVELDNLENAFSLETERYAADCRLQDVHFGLVNPLKNGQIAAALADTFSNATLISSIERIPAHLDLDPALPHAIDPDAIDSLLPSTDIDPSLYQSLFLPFIEAGLKSERAFTALDSVEQRQLLAGIPPLLETFSEDFLLGEGEREQTESHMRTLRLAKRVDLAHLFAAAGQLAALTDPATLKEIRRHARKKSVLPDQLPTAFQGSFLFAAPTAWGWFLIGDKGPNFYGADAALIIDLGGDDTYLNNCGAPIFLPTADSLAFERQSPAGLLIDFGGNDRYIGNGWGATGAAVGGIGLLVDLAGDDLYQGDRLTQGAAFCGVGLLWDRRGNDTYLAQEWAQGAAFFGAGMVVDDAGRDFYSAAQFSQAFGGSRAFALLHDKRGDDHYLADRKIPSGYGTHDIYSGWSQGVGCGFRGFSSGGIGLLLDTAGEDSYQAGNFSQGLGYFFGLGILADRSGDDHYRGTRYTQGASAHQAIGILIDDRGDDRYEAQIAAGQAGAWDASIAWLIDRSGDDHYTAQHLAQGAAAMNGLALLLDGAGQDSYHTQSGQAEGSSYTYWGGRGARNLGLLIDLGTALDTYNLAARKDSATFTHSGVGLFSDR
jgi:hypothetical protein